MNRKNDGFTIWELMIAVAIICILSSIAVPSAINWRERAKVRGAFENLRGDLQWAKIRAIRNHDTVAVVFESGRYEINDAAGLTLRSRQLAAGVVFNLGSSTVPVDPDNISNRKARFDSRGRCPDDGTLVLVGSSGEQRQISINPLGQIR